MVSPSLLVSLMLLTAVAGSGVEGAVSVEVPSRVTGTVGSSVILPCTFKSSYSEYRTVEITVIWKMKEFYTGPVLFNVTNRSKGSKEFENEVHTNVNGRYKLPGDPRQRNASLEVVNATLDDSHQYFCRVEVKRQGLPTFKTETKSGITLEVTGSPIILQASVKVISDALTTIECLVEGHPPPNIIWIDPQNNQLPENGSDTPVTLGPGKYQILGVLRHPKSGGNYTCLAVNDQGNTTHSIYLPDMGQKWHLLLIIGILVGSVILIIVIVIILVIRRRKRGKAEFNPGSKRDQYLKVSMRQQSTSAVVPCASEQDPKGSEK